LQKCNAPGPCEPAVMGWIIQSFTVRATYFIVGNGGEAAFPHL
jgi:hypothetical protein